MSEYPTYPKINTLFNRDFMRKNIIIENDLSKPEFKNINTWIFTEKIDGTNIRIIFDFENKLLIFGGKTDNAQIPAKLYAALTSIFSISLFESVFTSTDPEKQCPKRIILFGEGYGAGIQSGGLYRKDMGFILFDVLVDQWWLQRNDVSNIADKMKIPVVPIIGIGSLDDGIQFVKTKMKSLVAENDRTFEGIVATSYPMVLFRDGTPVKWKLKVKDYTQLETHGVK